MAKPGIIFIGQVPAWDRDEMDRRFEVHFGGLWAEPAKITGEMKTLQAIAFRGHGTLGAAYMDLLPELKLISNYGVGYDQIDVAAARERGIAVTNTPDVLTGEVADLTVAMMLALTRDLAGGEAWLRSGNWAQKGNYALQRRMFGKRAGIVGLGRIGAEIARRLAAFDMPISYWSRSRKAAPSDWSYVPDLVDLAASVDFLVVALAGGTDTAGLVTREALEALGPKGTFVNISRGTTVDEEALLDCLETGKLGWAALDVFMNEPQVNPRFLALKNVHLQPHVASATEETRQAMGMLMIDNVSAWFDGRPLLTPV